MQIKEIDDLDLVKCQPCMGRGNFGVGRRGKTEECDRCHGDGLNLIRRVKYYTWESRRRPRAGS